MAHLAAVPDTIDDEGTATLFLDRVFRQHGMSKAVVSDRDAETTNTCCMRHMLYTPFHGQVLDVHLRGAWHSLGHLHRGPSDPPQTDGQTERVNRVVEDVLRSICAETPERWSAMLPLVEFALTNAVHASTGYTPFYVNGLSHPRVPMTPPRPGSGLSGGEKFAERLADISPLAVLPRGRSQDSDLVEPLAGRPAGQSDHDGSPIVPEELGPVQPLVQRVNLIATAIATLMNVLNESSELTQILRERSHHARPRQRMGRSTRDRSRPGRNATSARQPSNGLPGLSTILRPVPDPTVAPTIWPISRRGKQTHSQRKNSSAQHAMITSKPSTDSGNGRDGNDAPPHAPGQLPDAPPVGGSASGSGGADGSKGDSSGKAEDVPASHTDPDHEPSHVVEPPQDDGAQNAEIERKCRLGAWIMNMKTPDLEGEDPIQVAPSWPDVDLEYAFHQKELQDFLALDPVMLMLELRQIGDLQGPLAPPQMATGKLDVTKSLMSLLKEVGLVAGRFDANDLIDLDLDLIQTSTQGLFYRRKALVGGIQARSDP
ncbi:unnamed protein product [Phytophthora fragariaefolia]|uniref:Unnamed protein product n=1 Tax=Phytophthora fragariaefolia TaxID=1490495 RepID=A0A9W7CXY2_9STRA|nr:unnamed protein product [Phytophthora fragariaefolia]